MFSKFPPTYLKKEIENQNLTNASNTEKKMVSNFKSALKSENDIESLSFKTILQSLKLLFPNKTEHITHDFLLNLPVDSKHARYSLEYFFFYNHKEEGKGQIKRILESENILNIESAQLYDIEHSIRNRLISHSSAKHRLFSIRPKSLEHASFSLVVEKYIESIYNFKNVPLHPINPACLELTLSIEEPFLKDTLSYRYFLLRANGLYRSGAVDEIIENSSEFLEDENAKPIHGPIHDILGKIYSLTDYKKSEFHLNRAIDIYKERGYEKIASPVQTLKFIRIYYGHLDKAHAILGLASNDRHNLDFFYYAKSKNDEKVLEILKKINYNELTDKQLAFFHLYKGIWQDNKDDLYQSVRYFIVNNDHFYKEFPIRELIRLEEDPIIINSLRSK